MACGFVKNLRTPETGAVSFTLQLTTPACPVKDEFRRLATEYVGELEWVEKVAVELTAAPAAASDSSSVEGRPGGLARVRHVIAVSSCKGGVGKSTVAVNLAYTLAQMGAAVGIMDADVYGPSLPTMTSPTDPVLKADPETGTLTPATYMGVSLVSFGFAGQGAAIMRGPMASGVVAQLLTQTDWGALDYLVVDFPPGTGDIQLTLAQRVPVSGAVVVTTPQDIALLDARKGLRMFQKVAVPVLGIVENMSTHVCSKCGHEEPIFGSGGGLRMAEQYGVSLLASLPLDIRIREQTDGGQPTVVAEPDSQIGRAYLEMARHTAARLSLAASAAGPAPRITVEET